MIIYYSLSISICSAHIIIFHPKVKHFSIIFSVYTLYLYLEKLYEFNIRMNLRNNSSPEDGIHNIYITTISKTRKYLTKLISIYTVYF